MSDFGDNFRELCRLCASFDAIKMDMFGEKGKERKLAEKIHACLPVKVSCLPNLFPRALLMGNVCFLCNN